MKISIFSSSHKSKQRLAWLSVVTRLFSYSNWRSSTCLTTNESSHNCFLSVRNHEESANFCINKGDTRTLSTPDRDFFPWGSLDGLLRVEEWHSIESESFGVIYCFTFFLPLRRHKNILLSAEACHRFRKHLCYCYVNIETRTRWWTS